MFWLSHAGDCLRAPVAAAELELSFFQSARCRHLNIRGKSPACADFETGSQLLWLLSALVNICTRSAPYLPVEGLRRKHLSAFLAASTSPTGVVPPFRYIPLHLHISSCRFVCLRRDVESQNLSLTGMKNFMNNHTNFSRSSHIPL